jgi:DNA-directed RNA polymerase subunit alpha
VVETSIDIKALILEQEDCDAGTVQKLRSGLAQGGTQVRSLREAADALKKKLESNPANAKKLHLKLGIASYFLGHVGQAVEHLKQGESSLASFYLGRALSSLGQYEQALHAFDKAEKEKYSASQVKLQRAGTLRLQGDSKHAREILNELEKAEKLSSHSAEYHFQLAGCQEADGDRAGAVKSLEKAIELDPGHSGALFRLGFLNDLAGNDDEAIGYYERCLKYPPLHKGVLNNLGILYEDNEKYDKAAECYNRLHRADVHDDRARLFLKDAQAATTMYYNPDEELDNNAYRQVLEIPVTDFELSVRSRNCLKKMNIRTLGDLTRVTEQQLLTSKNFGETSLDEIKEIMNAKGLRLGQSLEQGAAYELRYRPPAAMSAEEQATLGKPVSELNLSVRARKCMHRLGITTLGELVNRTADELLEAKNFGQTSLAEVRDKLTGLGLKLRND